MIVGCFLNSTKYMQENTTDEEPRQERKDNAPATRKTLNIVYPTYFAHSKSAIIDLFPNYATRAQTEFRFFDLIAKRLNFANFENFNFEIRTRNTYYTKKAKKHAWQKLPNK